MVPAQIAGDIFSGLVITRTDQFQSVQQHTQGEDADSMESC